jgi:haloalkane dehalogenase
MSHYRQPFASPGEDRRPTLSWPRNVPIEGEPADVVAVVNHYCTWLAGSDVPKLFINADPGAIINGRIREVIRTWPNLTEATVAGRHFIQEDSPDEIGKAIERFARRLRSALHPCRAPANSTAARRSCSRSPVVTCRFTGGRDFVSGDFGEWR